MQLQRVISNSGPDILQVGEYQVAKVTHVRAIENLYRMQPDAILVDRANLLKEILLDDQLYLTPLFFIGKTDRQCDGQVSDESDPTIERKLGVLLPAVKVYNEIPLTSDSDKRLLTKILRYLLTRKKGIYPEGNRYSKIGYSFPLIEDMSIEADPLQIIKHLNEFTAHDYFTAQPVDKINICYDCNGSYLNFSECCTKCNSLDLKSEELVHHFRCAYVGPQSDFLKDEKMVCPKCDHQLKHIGIDYDKPSEIHSCRSCNHRSQETKMKAKCVDCGKENELEQLITHEVHEYKPTLKAQALAKQSPKAASFGAVEPASATTLVNLGTYNLIRSHEGRRVAQNGRSAFDMVITVSQTVLDQLNKGMQLSLLEELATIVRPYIEANDLITVDEHKHLRALLLDRQQTDVLKLQEVLRYNLNKMLCDNGWSHTNVVIITTESISS